MFRRRPVGHGHDGRLYPPGVVQSKNSTVAYASGYALALAPSPACILPRNGGRQDRGGEGKGLEETVGVPGSLCLSRRTVPSPWWYTNAQTNGGRWVLFHGASTRT